MHSRCAVFTLLSGLLTNEAIETCRATIKLLASMTRREQFQIKIFEQTKASCDTEARLSVRTGGRKKLSKFGVVPWLHEELNGEATVLLIEFPPLNRGHRLVRFFERRSHDEIAHRAPGEFGNALKPLFYRIWQPKVDSLVFRCFHREIDTTANPDQCHAMYGDKPYIFGHVWGMAARDRDRRMNEGQRRTTAGSSREAKLGPWAGAAAPPLRRCSDDPARVPATWRSTLLGGWCGEWRGYSLKFVEDVGAALR